jgi:hypothetical protein
MDFTLVQSLEMETAMKFVNDSVLFDQVLTKLTDNCRNCNYATLHICCYLCDCMGHVAKDCTSQKLKSGMETVAFNYINRKHRISNEHLHSSDSIPSKPKKKNIYAVKRSKHNSELREKIENFHKISKEEQKLIKKQATIRVIDRIIEESDEEDF